MSLRHMRACSHEVIELMVETREDKARGFAVVEELLQRSALDTAVANMNEERGWHKRHPSHFLLLTKHLKSGVTDCACARTPTFIGAYVLEDLCSK
eukprot:5103356-Amphidinium_carterae.1